MLGNPLRILVVENQPAYARTIGGPLKALGYDVVYSHTARETMNRVYKKTPDLIILDTELPDLDGRHLCSELKNDMVFRHIPIILIHRELLPSEELDARESGADDYLRKPLDTQEVHGRIQQILRRGTIGVNRNLVTGLPGYNSVIHRINETIDEQRPFAICLMDLEGLRYFNHRYGYDRGDDVLRMSARVMIKVLKAVGRDLDFLGHIGADDFILITTSEDIDGLCTKILEEFDRQIPHHYEPFDLEKGHIVVQGRRGEEILAGIVFLSIAIITSETGKPQHVATILEQGAELLTYAKKSRRSRWVKERRTGPGSSATMLLKPAAPSDVVERIAAPVSNKGDSLVGKISAFRELVRKKDLRVYFQPIVCLETNEIYGYEALLRGPAGTYFESPVILFSMARETEMVLELDILSFQKVLAHMEHIPSPLKLFFNVSPESFYSPMFREIVLMAKEHIPPARMVLEVTRKRRILEYKAFRDAAEYFKQKGFRLAVDDAQSGTLSLHTILELVPDFVKVDISVVRGIASDKEKQRLFRQFINYCEKQGAELIPEGVESREEKEFIKKQGARLAQGFLFSRPRPLPTA